ncbi:peptidoglycan-binding protein [Streptomyces sp. TRM66268-LWL]|uniref:Peptidoglycan-binding protein n=1 Tax=Streptomyces polyasparticus TaxID=2767826 RepID=A0ABR7SJT6_9ACTN|nr:peptidoglycan-binding domain-containing protein [Streptomyces polyasparticus]MBC9715756.1 peptidoglycan-binding protein [Streptomyces polyasparticus]
MMKLRALRTKVGISAAAVALSGAGLGLATATPASAAYAGYCNGWASKAMSGATHLVAKLPAYNGNINCQMYRGASNNGVKALQIALNECYSRSLTEDGIFGDKTKTALIYAQGQEDIGTDGGYGYDTRTNIGWYFKNTTGSGGICAYL